MESRSTKHYLVWFVLLSHGLGILGGFTLFYSFYKTQCAVLLEENRRHYNTSLKETQYSDVDALTKQQELLERHERTLSRVSELQTTASKLQDSIDTHQATIAQLEAELEQKDVECKRATQASQKTLQRLTRQLELTQTMMEEKVLEVEALKQTSDNTNEGSPQQPCDSDVRLLELTASLRQRDFVHCQSTFGKAPYHVLMVLQSKNQRHATLEVELPHPSHATFLFLTLVQNQLYKDTTLSPSDDDNLLLVGGSPSTTIKATTQSKLLRKYAELGLSMPPLLFREPPMECGGGDRLPLQFVGRGPDFAIGKYIDGLSCFATIASHDLLLDKTVVTIVDARILNYNKDDDDEAVKEL